MELRERWSCVNIGETYVTDSSSTSDDDGSGFEALEEDMDNSPISLLVEDKVSGSSGDAIMPKLRSMKLHEKGGNSEAQTKKGKSRGGVVVTELWSKKVHDKGDCSKVDCLNPRRVFYKV